MFLTVLDDDDCAHQRSSATTDCLGDDQFLHIAHASVRLLVVCSLDMAEQTGGYGTKEQCVAAKSMPLWHQFRP
jgi:hypothetical protein